MRHIQEIPDDFLIPPVAVALTGGRRIRFRHRPAAAPADVSRYTFSSRRLACEPFPAHRGGMGFLKQSPASLAALHRQVTACQRCPRLRSYCLRIASEKRLAYSDWTYWGKPVPGFGDPDAELWVIGLAPAAHGANRTGRIFTGDRSGDFLYAALHRAGHANQPTSVSRDDGLCLTGCYISASARCAPPGNKPLPEEVRNCSDYLDQEWAMLARKRVLLALGRIAWDAARELARRHGCRAPTGSAFGHGAMAQLQPGLALVGSYHVSQQNTFTGKLTPTMFDAVLQRCRELSCR
jgi:uracil-DNA glycosylase family 4